jgi:hypothetical protein
VPPPAPPPEELETVLDDLAAGAPAPASETEVAAGEEIDSLLDEAAPDLPGLPGPSLSETDLRRLADLVVSRLAEQIVREVAWEVVPETAERLVRERLRQLEREEPD